MKNRDSFITQAMLSSYLTVDSKDYLELLMPFVLQCLPEHEGVEVDIGLMQENLNEQFQLDILYNVVDRLLRRLCKKNKGAYIEKKNKQYYTKKIADSTDFDRRRDKIRTAIEMVICKMQKFMEEVYYRSIAKEKATEYLSIFLETYNYTVYKDVGTVSQITIKDTVAESNYYVAQFIRKEYEQKTEEFSYILELIKGTLIAKAIYFFMKAPDDTITKIRKTDFYLDTRLLIDILGFDSTQGHQAAIELIKLIKDQGGSLKTFSYYVGELKGILHAYAEKPSIRLSLSLSHFMEEGVSSADALATMGVLEMMLDKYGITVIEKPEYIDNITNQNWHIDYAELRKVLNESIEYRKTSTSDYYTDALIHDVDTIEAIAYYRGMSRECSVFDCSAIFVTRNKDIESVVYHLYREERFKHGEINFVITDIDLTAVLWFSTFGKQKSLPLLRLLENAYAACVPSEAVMKKFLETIDRLSDDEKITRETAVLLRTQYQSLDDLSELTHNRVDQCSKQVIVEMENKLHNRTYKKVLNEVKQEKRKEIEKYAIDENEKILQEVKNQENRLEELNEELAATSELLQNTRDELHQQSKELEDTRKQKSETEILQIYVQQRIDLQKKKHTEEMNRQKEEIREERERIVKIAENLATKFSNRVKYILYTLTSVVYAGIILVFAYCTYLLSDISKQKLIPPVLLVGSISVVSTVVLLFPVFKYVRKRINRLCKNIYSRKYADIINGDK